jgi:hypothetical protein
MSSLLCFNIAINTTIVIYIRRIFDTLHLLIWALRCITLHSDNDYYFYEYNKEFMIIFFKIKFYGISLYVINKVIMKHHYEISIADTGITEQQHWWNKVPKKTFTNVLLTGPSTSHNGLYLV